MNRILRDSLNIAKILSQSN